MERSSGPDSGCDSLWHQVTSQEHRGSQAQGFMGEAAGRGRRKDRSHSPDVGARRQPSVAVGNCPRQQVL